MTGCLECIGQRRQRWLWGFNRMNKAALLKPARGNCFLVLLELLALADDPHTVANLVERSLEHTGMRAIRQSKHTWQAIRAFSNPIESVVYAHRSNFFP